MAGKFKPGQSGNPSGRPKGVKDRRVALRELFDPHAPKLIEMAVGLALAGDTQALRICIDRVVPPAKDEPLNVALPAIATAEDCAKAQGQIIALVACGDLLPTAAERLAGLVEQQRRALETSDLAQRLDAIEEQLKGRP